VDLERLPDRGDDDRCQRGGSAVDGGHRRPDRAVRPVRAPAHRRRLPPGGGPARRVLPAPTVLRPRHPRRFGEGLNERGSYSRMARWVSTSKKCRSSVATTISMSSASCTRERGLKRATPLAPPSPRISSGASGSPESTVVASIETCTI